MASFNWPVNSSVVTATNPSVGTNGAAIPSSSTQIGAEDGSGNLNPLIQTANGLKVDIQASVIPTGGATSALQVLGNASLSSVDSKTPALVGGNVPVALSAALPVGSNVIGHVINDAGSAIIGKVGIDQTTPGTTNLVSIGTDGVVGLGAGSALVGKVGIDQTTPGTTNKVNIGTDGAVAINAALPAGAAILGKVGIDQTTPGTTNLVSIGTNGVVKTSANANGSQVTGNVSTVITLSPPSNAVGFILQGKDSNTANIRWGLVSASTISSGNQLQPGRDTGYVPAACNVSICSESGTNEYQIVWVLSA